MLAPMRLLPACLWLTASLAALTAQTPLAELVRRSAPFDLDGDGRAELRRLEWLAERGAANQPLVVLLVELRLWQAAPQSTAPEQPAAELRQRLHTLADDIAAEGHRVLLLGAEVHSGPPHQDGRTVLAMRRLFQRLHAAAPMAAAVLVGHFPDALLVRTCNWRRNEALQLPGRDGVPVPIGPETTNLRAVPEIVAHRCDLVLADLDGAWEACYVPGPATLRSAWAVFGPTVPEAGGVCTALQLGELAVTDVFHVRDGAAIADPAGFALYLDAKDRDHECSTADRALGNPLARPEIAVSRLDARGVAVTIDAGALAADASGKLVPAACADLPWSTSLAAEVALLNRYLARNHAFRTKAWSADQRRPAAIAHGLGGGMAVLREADPAWAAFAEAGYDVTAGDLVALAQWLQRPAMLRTLRAHSDAHGAAFGASDPAALANAAGPAWVWHREGERFVPSWAGHRRGHADLGFYLSLSANQALAATPFVLLHTGCEALSPPGSVEHAYDAPEYGRYGHAEAILFHTPCVAMLGRAKVFYDEPREFAAVLAAGGSVGAAWRRYFEVEAQAADWAQVGDDIGRKRAYFWSVVGDATLRLSRAAGAGELR